MDSLTKNDLEIFHNVMDKLEQHQKGSATNYDNYYYIGGIAVALGILIFCFIANNSENKTTSTPIRSNESKQNNFNDNLSCQNGYCKSFF